MENKQNLDRIIKLTKLDSQANWSRALPYIFGTLPFVNPFLALGAGLVGGAISSFKRNEISVSDEDYDFDNVYEESFEIEDASVSKSTYFGQSTPYRRWREDIEEAGGSDISPERYRDIASTLYPKMRPYGLPNDLLTRHVCFLAQTGSGKTEFFMSILSQQIKKGGGVIIVEAKSDSDFAGSAYRMCEEADRLDDLSIINLEHPEISHSWNPLHNGGVRQQISMLKAIQGSSSEEFWEDVARFATTAAILSLALQPGNPSYHIRDLIPVLSDFQVLKQLVKTIREEDSKDHLEGKRFLATYLNHWYIKEKEAFDEAKYKNLLLGTISKLNAYSHSEYVDIVNTYNPDVDIKKTILEGKIVILSMSALADKDGAELLGRLFIADIARAVGEIQQEKSKPLVPCPVLLDEYGSFKDATQINLFQLARSANVPMIIAMQGKGFLEAGKDKAFAENVMGNCWHHIYSDVRDTNTRDFACTMAGSLVYRLNQESVGESSGESKSSDSTGVTTDDSQSRSFSTGFKESRDNLLRHEDFASLDKGDALIVGKSGVHRLRLPLMKMNKPPAEWSEMILVKHPKKGRPGIGLFDKYADRCIALIEDL